VLKVHHSGIVEYDCEAGLNLRSMTFECAGHHWIRRTAGVVSLGRPEVHVA
jgi:hypothetical protein